MSKDPAILWYFDNWAGGTVTLTRHQKGCYMDLLNAQFNNGHLSIEEIKTVLGSDFSAWNTLQKKFDTDSSGLFFSKRMDDEILKRKNFSQKEKDFSGKQSERVSKRYPKSTTVHTTVLPQEGNGNGNGVENSNENEKPLKPFFKIAGEIIYGTPAEVYEQEHQMRLENLFMTKFRGLPKEKLFEEFNAKYQFTEFEDVSHFHNAILATGKIILEQKTNGTNKNKSNAQLTNEGIVRDLLQRDR